MRLAAERLAERKLAERAAQEDLAAKKATCVRRNGYTRVRQEEAKSIA